MMDDLSRRLLETMLGMSLDELEREVLKRLEQAQTEKKSSRDSSKKRPRSRERWAERNIASYLRRNGCGIVTNVFYGRREVDALALCRRGGVLHILVVEVKSGRQLIDMPVLSRLRKIVRRIVESKRPYLRINHGTNPPKNIFVHAMLVIGLRCALPPKTEEYAINHDIEVYRYTTQLSFRLLSLFTS